MKAIAKITAFLAVFAGAIVLIHYGALFIFGKDPGLLAHHGPGQFTFYALFILNVFLFQRYVNKASVVSLGLKRFEGWRRVFLKGWLAGMAAFLGYCFLLNAFGVVEFQIKSWPKFWLNFPVAILVACSAFLVALTEDVLFRGFFLQTLLKDLPKWPSIVLTGILFGFFHKLNRVSDFWTLPEDAMLFGGIFCLNILLCQAFFQARSLYLPIGIHSGLVFAKMAVKKLRLVHVLENGSYWFGLDGDPRRGFLAWGLFLAGVFVLQFLAARGTGSPGDRFGSSDAQ